MEVNNQYYINADHFIIATGGVSYPSTGSRGDGLRFSKSLGHNIIKVKPSLVPIELKNTWIKFLTGLTLKNIEISLFNDSLKKPIYKNQGEMLFTSYGLSGPIILKASRYIENDKNYSLFIDLKPALTPVSYTHLTQGRRIHERKAVDT